MKNRWFTFCLVLALLFSSIPGVMAVSSREGVLYQNRFYRTLGGLETVRDSYSDAGAIVTGTLDVSTPSALADDEPGVFRLEVKKDTQKVKGRVSKSFNTPIYTIGSENTLILETKVFYTDIHSELGLFQLIADDGQWIKKPLIVLKPQLEPATPWVVGDCNLQAVIPDTADMTHPALEEEWAGKWHHFMAVLQGNTYDIYHNGVKLNEIPIEIQGAEGKAVSKLEHTLMHWGDSYVLFDDYVVQTDAAFCQQGGNVENGQIGVNPAVTRKVLDYNHFLDESTLETVGVYRGDEELTQGVTVEVDSLDKTRLIVDFGSQLDSGADYRIDLSLLKDRSGASLTDNQEIRFTTGTAQIPEIIQEYAAMDFESQDQAIAGGSVEMGIWSAQINGQSADPKEIFVPVALSGTLHDLTDPQDKTTLELKIKTNTAQNVRQPFRFNNQDGTVIPSALLMNDGGVRLVGQGINQELVGDFQGDEWIHLYQVWQGNACDLYVNGQKMNEVPVLAQQSGQINNWNIYYKAWSNETLSLDDIRAQSLARMQLQKTEIPDGAQDILVQPETYTFDFNNPIDPSSLDSVQLYQNDEKAQASVQLDPEDFTRVLVTMDSLEFGGEYELHFSGLTDLFGTQSEDIILFQTTADSSTEYAKIVSSSPENGATDIVVDELSITVRFDKKMDPATILPENVLIQPPVPVKEATLEEDGKTVTIALGSNLLVSTQYTLSFSPEVKTLFGDGRFGVAEGEQLCFTTKSVPDTVVNEFDRLAVGRDGLAQIINTFYAATDEAEKLQDQTRLYLGNQDYAALVFQMENGLRDFVLQYFDINYESNGKGVIGLEMSRDGVEYEPVPDVVSETVRTITDLGGYSGLYSMSATLPEGMQYVRVSISRTPDNTASCWTPRLKNMVLNAQPPAQQSSTLISSTPENGEVNADICQTLLLEFDLPFYACSVDKSGFTVTDREVESVYLSQDYRTVTLTLDKKVDYGKTYEVSAANANMVNQYGQPVTASFSFSTKDAKVVLKAAALYNQEGEETALCEGTLTPRFQLENVTQEPQNAVIAAAIYREGILEDIRLSELSQIQPGEETFSLDPMTIEDAQGRSVKLLAFQSIQSLSPLPTEGLGIVDTEYFPGFVRKAVTLSYDDGPQRSDITMMEMLNAKGLKATFNVNSDRIETNGQEIAESFFAAAASHEIANHSKGHPNYYEVDLETALASIRDGKQELEEFLGEEVRGFAYPYNRPYGRPNEEAINQYLAEEGVAYARPSTTNGSFALPQDFLDWKFTCHHNELEKYKWDFYDLPDNGQLQLLAVWGHSWEFSQDSTWDSILAPFLEELAQRKDEIWNPTNIELVDYVQAKNALVITKDSIYNPSDIDVYVTIDGVPTIIRPHQIVY